MSLYEVLDLHHAYPPPPPPPSYPYAPYPHQYPTAAHPPPAPVEGLIEKDIYAIFDKYGPVDSMKLSINWAFVNFRDHEAARKGMIGANGINVTGPDGRSNRINVSWSISSSGGERDRGLLRNSDPDDPSESDNLKLHVGNIPEGITEPDFIEIFSKYGAVNHVKLALGWGLVNFTDHEGAKNALAKTHGIFIGSHKINKSSYYNDLI
eukprot:gene7677-8984_t